MKSHIRELGRFGDDPLLAGLHGEIAAELVAPAELLGHRVVGAVPARVLHQSERNPRVYRILRVRTRHRLVLWTARQAHRQVSYLPGRLCTQLLHR